MKMIKRSLSAVVLLCATSMVWANSASDQLRAFVNDVQAATGSFSQHTVDSNGTARAGQEGVFAFQRQGKFRWETQKPYEQLVLSDGKFVYQYDADLMQVTQRGVDEAVGASPAAILFGSGRLDDAFALSEMPDRDGMQWLQAVPKNADAGFAHVNIGFQNTQPVRIELLDSFGQTTHIELRQLQPQSAVDSSLFVLDVPEGVDVVTMP